MNRQRYMAELAKLLGFMSSWDRAGTLAKYNALFDAAGDEAALIDELGTPTKLAISIARDYVPTEKPQPPAPEEKPAEPETNPEEKAEGPEENADEPENSPETAEETAGNVENSVADGQKAVVNSVENVEKPSEPAKNEGAVFDRDSDIDEEMMSALSAAVARQMDGAAAEESVSPASAPEAVPDAGEKPEKSSGRKGRVRGGLLALYLVPAIVIGLPVAIILVALGVPFIIMGVGLIWATVTAALEYIGVLSVFADTLLLTGGGLGLCAVGLLLLWLGLWISVSLGSLWIGGVVLRLGAKLCLRKEEQ